MSEEFQEWFKDYFLEETMSYAFFSRRALASVKRSIPISILLKSEYTFLNGGYNVVKPHKKRMCKLQYSNGYNGLNDIATLLKKECVALHYYTPYNNDEMCKVLDPIHQAHHYYIDEWKDTAMLMKRMVWDLNG